ncbi:MAG: ABC transporter ATP-binding protein [Proteobacteria bacterium]|nr:ABC transporter ATP-binding protein [Pseudomonadota bacterium]
MFDKQTDGPYAIEVRALTKRFGQRVAIEDLCMHVRHGQIQGLAGANGGGKSTSLRVLSGLLEPDSGTAHVLGYELPSQEARVRRSIGYLPQRNWLYAALSVRENLVFRATVFGLKSPSRVAEQQIEAFGLNAYASNAVATLSGGRTRLVELAAVLIHQPRVLLLDEPTAGLDPAARQVIWRRLASLAAQGAAIVLSTHDLAEAQFCSHLILMSEGRTEVQGAPHEIPNQLDASAIVVSGLQSAVVMESLPPGLMMAAYPHGNNLRLVIARKCLAEVENRLGSLGCLTERTSLTLEDAALVVAHRGRGLR